MAEEVIVHLSGVAKREAEAAVGHELVAINNQGDLFRLPVAVAERLNDLPPSPPKAEDPQRVKAAARALPVDVESLSEESDEGAEPLRAEVTDEDGEAVDGGDERDVSGDEVRVDHV